MITLNSRPVVFNPVLTTTQARRWTVKLALHHAHGMGNSRQACTQCK